jgi:predicted transcriptional regulator
MKSVKQELRELADKLPEESSWDDVMYQIYVRQKIEAGLKDVEEGRFVSDEEIAKEFDE